MTERSSTLSVLTSAFALSALFLSGCAASSQLADRVALGRDAEGAACTANRNFNAGDLSSPFDTAYAITCEGAAASRPLGTVSVVPVAERVEEAEDGCGAASTVTLAGVGPATARRCNDKVIAAQATVIRFNRGGKSYRGASLGPQTGPMTRALVALATGVGPDAVATGEPIDVASLASAPSPKPGFSGPGETGFDPTIALRQGIALNLQGQNAEASRVLNDAISRNPASTPMSVQIEFQLEAGLADSKIQFTDDAADHFRLAKSLLDANPQVDQGARLERKRTTYLAIDSLNRRDWSQAIALLASNSNRYPLEDLAVLADLNQPPRNDPAFQITATNTAELGQVALDAQRSWVASVAYLSRGDESGEKIGSEELGKAIRYVNALLNARVDPSSIAWLAAQIERQSGRLAARRATRAGGRDFADTLTKFDCALAALTGQRPPNEAGCAIPLTPAARARLATTLRVSGPVIAETALERTTFLARSGAPQDQVLANYKSAIDGLIAADRSGSLAPAGLENYLDLLADVHSRNPGTAVAEDFFRAIQAVGEPGIARQFAELQAAVASGSATTSKLLRERSDLKRDIAALRYQIADAANDPALKGSAEEQRLATETLAAREAERQAKEARLASIGDLLQADRGLRAIDDAPVTIAQVQAPLADDEVYFKVLEVRTRSYGVVIGKQRVQIYKISGISPSQLAGLAALVRASIRDDSAKIPIFKVSAANLLFEKVAGPAAQQLLAARSIVVDPGGPLGDLPAGVLVTDKASVQAYLKTRAVAPNDYSKVSFLAQHAALSTALSPRSFIETRAAVASKAPRALIGFGQHATPVDGQIAPGLVRIGLGCLVDRADLVAVSRANTPISAAKLGIAAAALNDSGAPEITGAAFSDTAVEARADLDQYKVLMFATHGLPELRFGCATVPPSLLTSIGEGDSDGFLSFGEISSLKLDANLVVLAACQTSSSASRSAGRRSGLEDGGLSLNGLVRAFLAANARSVLATYWKVSVGVESDELFKNFYTRGRTATIGESLRAAQTELIRQPRYSHPYYWGAYFVVGDSSKSMLAGRTAVAALR